MRKRITKKIARIQKEDLIIPVHNTFTREIVIFIFFLKPDLILTTRIKFSFRTVYFCLLVYNGKKNCLYLKEVVQIKLLRDVYT